MQEVRAAITLVWSRRTGHACSGLTAQVPPLCRNPIFGNLALRIRKRDLAPAYGDAKRGLEAILALGLKVRLGPQVLDDSPAAKANRDIVVTLVL